MDALYEWIKDKKYLRAINIRVSEPKVREADEMELYTSRNDVDDEWHVAPRTRRTYICPRGLDRHRGDPRACGYKCRQAQGENEPEYVDETYIEVITIRKEVLFDQSVCRA